MMRKSVVGVVLAVVLAHGVVRAACSKDSDCKGDRVCSDEGKCVAPNDEKPKAKRVGFPS